jgi:hypothetical protein
MTVRSERFLRHPWRSVSDVHVTPVSEYRVLKEMVKRIGEVRCCFPDERVLWKNGIASEDGVFFQQPSTGVCFIRSCHALTVMTCIQKGISHVRA